MRLAIPTLEVADPEDIISWDGEIGNATFPVSVPAEARPGPHAGTATFHAEQLAIAKLHFVLEVGRGVSSVTPLAVREVRCKCAFASYASEDRDEVLGRLQGILKVLPDLDLFLDVASLRSGERWEERLHQEIGRRDTLYLFWSHAASRSPWVEREWRTALALRGIGGIDPVPLVSPEDVPPRPNSPSTSTSMIGSWPSCVVGARLDFKISCLRVPTEIASNLLIRSPSTRFAK